MLLCLFALLFQLSEQAPGHGSLGSASPFPASDTWELHKAGRVAGHGRTLQERRLRLMFLAGDKAPLTVTLSAAIQWTPRLFRAGRVRIRPEGFVCGTTGSSEMDAAVQPSCVGSICLGPMPTGNPGTAFWNGVKIARPGIYTLCWCEPRVSCAGPEAGFSGVGCCLTDSDFSVDRGEIEVQGPAWAASEEPLLGEPFNVDLTGSVVRRSSRLLFRFPETVIDEHGNVEGGPCGGSLSTEERDASEVLVREDRRSYDHHTSSNFTVRLLRRRIYIACWCAGEGHSETNLQGCATDDAFLAEIRSILPRGPRTESIPASHAVVGVPFALQLSGNALGYGDRLRIVDGSRSCGTSSTYVSSAVSYFVCRGENHCVQSAVSMQPSILAGSGEAQTETWDPVVLTSPGLYRMCWCVDNTWNGQTLDSYGFCASHAQFAVPVGTLVLEGIDDQQSFYCHAFLPCIIHVSSHLAVSINDGIFIASQQDLDLVTCGSGLQGVSLLATSVNESFDAQGNRNATISFRFFPHAGPPGTFRVCYCQSVGMGACNEPTVFAQQAGVLYTTPPPDGVQISLQEPPQYCLVGRSCSIHIYGIWASQLHVSDAFRAVPSRFECGNAPLSVTSAVFSLSHRGAVAGGGGGMRASFLHSGAWSKSSGDYRLCYCSLMMLSYGQICDYHGYFRQSTGSLFMLGVRGMHKFRCSQGFACNITVPGWRFEGGDRLLLLAGENAVCGAPRDDLELAAGFASNPAGIPAITSKVSEDIAEFAFSMAYGAGASRVCFCALNTSTSGCHHVGEFTQDVGVLTVTGAITSVSLSSSHPALTSILSLVVNAEQTTTVTCAVMEDAMPTIPSRWDVVRCDERVASCLGVERLQWLIRPGANIVHVPLTFNRSLTASMQLPQVHAWCAAGSEQCPGARCAMPPTPVGQVIDLLFGVITFQTWRIVRGEALTFTISATPLNTKGDVGVFNSSSGCGSGQTLLNLGRPARSVPLSSATWEDVVFATPGRYLLCWCDRGYWKDCRLWHRAGVIVVAGPAVSRQWLPSVNPSQAFTVNLTGVDFADGGLLAMVLGSNCSDVGTRLVNISSPFSISGDTATWILIAPTMEGNFTLCWGEGATSTDQRRLQTQVFSTLVGFFQTIARKDCEVTSWVTGNCDRPCGKGSLVEHRSVLALPIGGGEECPTGTGLTRTKSCNEQPCPTAAVYNARTVPVTVQPGQIFKVVLEGEFLAPYEDRIVLLRGDEECGIGTQILGGATCDVPGSSATNLECGDGTYSVRVEEPGSYRICFCDASISVVWKNGTQIQCGSAATFKLTPINGSQFVTLGPKVSHSSDGLFSAGEEGSGKGSGARGGGTPEDSSQDIVVILSLSGGGLMLVVALCAWRCLIKDYFVKKEVKKPVKVIDTKDLVAQATREVWNAYARSIVEGVEDEELRAASQAILDENARVAALTSGREGECMSQPEPEPSDPYSSSSGSVSTSRLTTPETGLPSRGHTPPTRNSTPPTGRRTTPPLTRGTTRGSTPATPKTGRTPPGSRACTPPTPKSHPSFFHESLPPLGAPKTPPPQGGSFLDMPLLGVSSGPQLRTDSQNGQSSSVNGQVVGAELDNEAFKQSGSSWRSSSFPTRTSSSCGSSYSSLSPRENAEASNMDAPMAPRGKPSPFVNLRPLQLPPHGSLESNCSKEPGTPPPPGTKSSEVLDLDTAPNPISPLGTSTLSSSTARPPGLEIPKPPPSIPHAPEGPPKPPPEGLSDIMNLKASLMAQLPSMPPPPPPPPGSKIGNDSEVPQPPLKSTPEIPSAPPPLLPSTNIVREPTTKQAIPHSSMQTDSMPSQEKVQIPSQGASKGWGFTSLFSGVRLPWSGSQKQSRSAKVSAMPPPAPTPQPIGTLMQGADHKENVPSAPRSEPIGTQIHEASQNTTDRPLASAMQPLGGKDKVLVDARSHVGEDNGVMAASRLPTQKPDDHHEPTESESTACETVSAEKTSMKKEATTDIRSEARSFMASLPKNFSASSKTKTPIKDTLPAKEKEPAMVPIAETPPETMPTIGQETIASVTHSSNIDALTSEGTLASVEDPVVEMIPTGTVINTTNAPLAIISETSVSEEVSETSRPQSAPYNSSETTSASRHASKQSQKQGKYIPGSNSERPSSASSSRQRMRPQALDDDVISEAGSEYQVRWTGREEPAPNANGMRSEVLEAQEKIRKEWHDKLAAETDWNKVPHPKATLGRPHASTRDKLRPTVTSSGRHSRTSAMSSQTSSAVSSPQHSLGMPGPPLPGGFVPGPPLQGMPGPSLQGMRVPGSPQSSFGSSMPGPPLAAPKGFAGRGPTLAPGPPQTAATNSRGPGRALPAWALK